MDFPSTTSIPLVVACAAAAISVAAAVAAAFWTARGWPFSVKSDLDHVQARVRAVEEESAGAAKLVGDLKHEMDVWSAHLEEELETLQKRRRRLAGEKGGRPPANGGGGQVEPGSPAYMDQLRAIARAQGHRGV